MKKWEIGANFAAHEDFVKLIREGNFTLHQAKCICYDIVSLFVKTVDKMNITEAVDLFSIAEFSTLNEPIETLMLLGSHIAEFIVVNLTKKKSNFPTNT